MSSKSISATLDTSGLAWETVDLISKDVKQLSQSALCSVVSQSSSAGSGHLILKFTHEQAVVDGG